VYRLVFSHTNVMVSVWVTRHTLLRVRGQVLTNLPDTALPTLDFGHLAHKVLFAGPFVPSFWITMFQFALSM
jgi:hypothetical protein